MAAFNSFFPFKADVFNKVHNLGADSLQVYLTNVAPATSNTVYNTPADLTTGGGYTAGGVVIGSVTSTQTAGTYKLMGALASPTWTGSGGGFGPFRYAVLYNNTAGSKQLIGWWDYGSSISVSSGNTFTVTLDATNGIIQMA